jgi:PAS domain S-box-containing protein
MLGTYHLNGLFDILKEIHFIYEPPKLWHYVLEESCKVLQAEAGTFFVSIKNDTELEVAAAFGVDEDRLKQVPFRKGMGISGWVLQYQQPALVMDVQQDNRFNSGVDAVTGVQTRSVLCVPVLSQKRIFGVLELINRKSGQFNPQDQEFMTVLGRQTAAAYQNLLMLDEVIHAKTMLQSLLENMSGGLIATNLTGQITLMNPSAMNMLQLKATDVIGKQVSEVLVDYPWFIQTLRNTLSSKNTVSRQEVTLSIQRKESRLGYTTILITDQQKSLLGAGVIFQQLHF